MGISKSYRFCYWKIVSQSESDPGSIPFTHVISWEAQLQQPAKWCLSFYYPPSPFSPTSNCNTGHHNLVNVCIHLKNKITCHIFVNNQMKMAETQYWVGQKVHSGFSVTTNFFPNKRFGQPNITAMLLGRKTCYHCINS